MKAEELDKCWESLMDGSDDDDDGSDDASSDEWSDSD